MDNFRCAYEVCPQCSIKEVEMNPWRKGSSCGVHDSTKFWELSYRFLRTVPLHRWVWEAYVTSVDSLWYWRGRGEWGRWFQGTREINRERRRGRDLLRRREISDTERHYVPRIVPYWRRYHRERDRKTLLRRLYTFLRKRYLIGRERYLNERDCHTCTVSQVFSTLLRPYDRLAISHQADLFFFLLTSGDLEIKSDLCVISLQDDAEASEPH